MNQSPVKTARIRKGMSQEELADITGYTQGYISFLESGKRTISVENLMALSEALRCNIQDLVDGRVATEIKSEIAKEIKSLTPLELEKILDYIQLLKKGRR